MTQSGHRRWTGATLLHQGGAHLLTLKKIVPNLVQLGDCRFKRRYKEPFVLTSHKSKAIERRERIGNLEINIDRKVFCEPRLDTACNFGRRWRRLCLADEVVC